MRTKSRHASPRIRGHLPGCCTSARLSAGRSGSTAASHRERRQPAQAQRGGAAAMTNEARSAEGDQLVLSGGRRLGYAQYGRPDGEPIMYFHGHPGSRLEASLAHDAAAASGFRVIALDRPGYGLSDFQPRRVVTDWPADVAAAADALGIDTFSVAGGS